MYQVIVNEIKEPATPATSVSDIPPVEEIYRQTVPTLLLQKVIDAVNAKPRKPRQAKAKAKE